MTEPSAKRPRSELTDKIQRLLDLGLAPSNTKDSWVHYPRGEEGFPGSPEYPHYKETRIAPEDVDTFLEDSAKDGKWLLWYPKEKLDEKWAAACIAFEKGLLWGTGGMKSSTHRDTSRCTGPNRAIVLYCAYRDEPSIMKSGRAIMRAMQYDQPMFYKLNSQTRRGTVSTGQKVNHTYRLFPNQLRPALDYQFMSGR
jgi:hypothetical protein